MKQFNKIIFFLSFLLSFQSLCIANEKSINIPFPFSEVEIGDHIVVDYPGLPGNIIGELLGFGLNSNGNTMFFYEDLKGNIRSRTTMGPDADTAALAVKVDGYRGVSTSNFFRGASFFNSGFIERAGVYDGVLPLMNDEEFFIEGYYKAISSNDKFLLVDNDGFMHLTQSGAAYGDSGALEHLFLKIDSTCLEQYCVGDEILFRTSVRDAGVLVNRYYGAGVIEGIYKIQDGSPGFRLRVSSDEGIIIVDYYDVLEHTDLPGGHNLDSKVALTKNDGTVEFCEVTSRYSQKYLSPSQVHYNVDLADVIAGEYGGSATVSWGLMYQVDCGGTLHYALSDELSAIASQN